MEENPQTDKGVTTLLSCGSLCIVLTHMFKITLWGRSGQAEGGQEYKTKTGLIDAELSLSPYFLDAPPPVANQNLHLNRIFLM